MSVDFEDTMFEGLNVSIGGKASASAGIGGKLRARRAQKKGWFGGVRTKLAKAKITAKPAATGSFNLASRLNAKIKTATASAANTPKKTINLPLTPKAPTVKIAAKAPTVKIAAKPVSVKATIAPPKVLKLPEAAREVIAAKIATKAVTHLAKKPPAPAKHDSHEDTKRKAHKAIKPICDACRCKPQKVIIHVERGFSRKGYPPATVHAMLAALHDMNKRLERAAIQKLATYEHKRLAKESAFRRTVLSRLHKIACNLPDCHPTRSRVTARIVRGAV